MDYVTLYDHPDKYLNPIEGGNPYCEGRSEFTRVYFGSNSEFKLNNSSTMTFAAKVKTLKDDQTIHIEQNSELVALASPLPCSFHRAFDEVLNYQQALEAVISCGFSTLLTSGTFPNVMEGKDVLKQLVVQANNRIEIMPGGGLRSTNILELNERVHANWYHSSAITDGTEIANPDEISQLKKKLQS
jgi:copper homeostasis protein CutC